MRNRVSGKEQRDQNLAERDGRRRVLQRGAPPGGQPNAAGQARDGVEIDFWDDLADELSPEVQPAVLSIVQELLRNACRHSKSRKVLLSLAQDDG